MNRKDQNYTKSLKLLIVEDDKSDALYLKELLLKSNFYEYNIYIVETFKDFSLIVKNELFDIVFCDINLSDSVGQKTLQSINQLELDIPVVIISGEEDLRLYEKASEYGFIDFLNKNEIQNTDFDKKIHYLLNKYANEKQAQIDNKLNEYQSRLNLISSVTGETAHQFNNTLGAMLGIINQIDQNQIPPQRKEKLLNYIIKLGEMSDQLITLSQKQELNYQPTSSFSLLNFFKDNLFDTKNLKDINCVLEVDLKILLSSLMSFFENYYSMSFSDIGITSFVEKKENLSMLKPFKYLKAKEFFHIKFSSKELFELEHLSSKQEFYYLVLKGVVEQHRGVISSVDKEINIYFPISESASLQTNVNEPVKLKRKIQNILYAEDQDDIRETTSELLRLNNYNVFEYENGLLALENFKNKNCDIDLVITDFSMPKLNGSDLFKQVRSVNQNIPCIFTSGYSQSEITKGGNLPPGTRYLKKPYDFKTLISVIEDIYSL